MDRNSCSISSEAGEMTAPNPEDFDLKEGVSIDEVLKTIESKSQTGRRIALAIFWVAPVTFGYCLSSFVGVTGWLWTYLLWVIWLALYLSSIRDKIINKYVSLMAENELLFYHSFQNWQYFNLEIGLGYWLQHKGVQLEIAVANFFQRRGWNSTVTSATGDGGVDVILDRHDDVFWCQCKGHSKPIPVAEVRRIAGATLKSGGTAKPVLISTNGFTKPALEEAAQLGVTCIDGVNLTQLAKMSDIRSLA